VAAIFTKELVFNFWFGGIFSVKAENKSLVVGFQNSSTSKKLSLSLTHSLTHTNI